MSKEQPSLPALWQPMDGRHQMISHGFLLLVCKEVQLAQNYPVIKKETTLMMYRAYLHTQ